jgi:hypothetical protein
MHGCHNCQCNNLSKLRIPCETVQPSWKVVSLTHPQKVVVTTECSTTSQYIRLRKNILTSHTPSHPSCLRNPFHSVLRIASYSTRNLPSPSLVSENAKSSRMDYSTSKHPTAAATSRMGSTCGATHLFRPELPPHVNILNHGCTSAVICALGLAT